MRRILLSLFALCACAITQAQTTIASDGFENSLTLFTATTGTAAYATGNSGSGDRVATSPFAAVGTYSLSATNTTLGITSSAINTVGYTGVSATMRLAAWSIASTGNGMELGDIVTVEVSPDNGATYYSTVRVLGSSGSNAYWSYSGGIGVATTGYDGNATPVDFSSTSGGAQTTNGYSTVTVTGLPATTQLRFRITMLNNATAERWTIDDFKVQGTLTAQSFRTITFTGASSDFDAGERFSASAANTDYYMAFDAQYLYLGAFRTSGTFGGGDNFAVYIDTDPRSTPASGNGTTAGRNFNNVTPTLPFNADYTSYTEQSYTDPLNRYNGSWATTGVTPTTNTNTTCREVRIALSDLGNPSSVYVTMWMGYNGGIFSNAPGSNVTASGTPTIAGFFGSFPIYKAGINPMTYRSHNTSAANGGGTAISDLTLTASGNIADDYGDITISNAAVGTVSIANASFSGSLTLNNTSTVALGANKLNVGGRGVGGTAGRIVMDNTSTTSIDGTSTVGTVNFLGLGQVSGSNSARTFGTNSTVALSGGVDFTSSVTNVNGVLQLNAGGYVNTNPPSYGSASTLIYNSGGTYTAGTEWTPNATSGAGVPANVSIGNGVNTTLSFGASTQFRRANGTMTIGTSNSLTLSSGSGGDLYLGGNYVNNGTYTSNNRAIFMNGSSAQTISGSAALAFPYLIINNAAGVSLSNAVTISNPGTLTLTAGNLSLGNNNLTITSGATIATPSSSSYIRTNGTGALIQTVAGSNVTYPVGNAAYNPLTFSNSGTSDTHNVRVVDGALTGANDVTYTVNRRWEITEGTTGGSVITPALTYNGGEENNATNWAAGTQNYVGLYNGTSWSQVAATQGGAGPFTVTAGASLSPAVATYSLGLGRDGGLGAAPPTISSISVSAPGSGTSGYVGTTVTVTGTNLTTVTIVRVGGVGGTAVTIASQNATTITFTAINLSGQIYVENGAGNATSASSYTNLGYITQANGVYTTAGTWLGGAVPVASANITIAHAVTLASAVANSVNLFTINVGSTFTMNSAAASITMTTLLNNGTWVSNSAGTTNIAAGGTITNNGTVTVTFGNMVFAGSGTVNGTNAWTFTNVTVNGGLTLTTIPNIQGSLTLNTGGFVTAAPTYISNGSLVYNTGGTFAMSNEWTGNGTAVGTGIPMNVTIQNATTVTFPTTNRGCAGNLTITTGGTTLNGTSGDLYIGGNFVHNGSTFTTNGRAVFFNGAAAQAISGTGTIVFDYLIINNSHTSGVTLNRNASVIATAGDVLQLLGTGPFNIGTAILTISGNGGNILTSGGARAINITTATNSVDITGTKTVTSSGGGTLTFGSTALGGGVRISAGVNFGSGLTTFGNNAYLTILGGGFVSTNSPTYGTGSTLSFNTGAAYGVGATDKTWGPGASGAGVPFNVLVNAAGTDVQINDNRSITNNLTITAGTLTNNTNTLDIGPSGGGNKVMTVNGGTLTNNGGNLNHNGNVVMSSGTFNMSGGTFMVDGNDGNSGTSVGSGTDLFTINSVVVNTGVTGGTLLINDPPFAGTGRVFTFTGSTSNRIWTGHTLQLGGSTGTHTSTATNGFNVDTYVGTVNLRLGHVIINGGSGTSRFTTASATSGNGMHIAGNLTINATSELRTLANGADVTVEGNVVNNGTLTILSDVSGNTALNFSTRIGGTTSANSVAQTVSGTGTFQNLTSGATAKFAEIIVNNTAGITFNIGEVSVANTVTFTNGILDVGTANDFILIGSATQTRTTGYLLRDATAAGFMKRTHASTGSHTYMIGTSSVYAPIVLNFSVNTLSRQMGVSVADGVHPDMNNPVTAVDYLSKYWRLYENGAGGNYTFTSAMTYVAGATDVVGTESSIRVSGWNGTVWTEYGAGSVASPTITSATITQATAPTLNNLVLTGRRNPLTVYTWTGGASNTSWADAGNWSPSGVPAAADGVVINTAPGFNVNITDARTVISFTLNGTGVLDMASTGSLTVTGAVTYANTATANLACGSTVSYSTTSAITIPALNYGNLIISGGARTWTSGATTRICGNLTTGGATQTSTGSTVEFNGTGAQTITGNTSLATMNITNTASTVTSATSGTVTVATGMNISASATYVIGTSTTLTLVGGSNSVINGTLRRIGTQTNSGNVTVTSTGVYDHASNTAILMVATWNAGSTCMVTGFNSGTNVTAGSQAFHHFIWNCPGQTTGVQCSGGLNTINGNFTILSTGATGQLILSNSDYTLNVAGDLSVTPTIGERGYLNLSGGGIGTVQVGGNFVMNSTGTPQALITETGSGSGVIVFNKAGLVNSYASQTYTQSGTAAFANSIALTVGGATPSYSTLTLLTDVTATSTVTVNNGGAMDFQNFLVSGPNFTGNSGGKLITAHVEGFVSAGAQGSIRTSVRSLNGGMRFEYDAASAQVTGNGVPSTATELVINNTNGVSLSSPLTLQSGSLTFVSGRLNLGNNDLVLAGGTTATGQGASSFVVTNGTGDLGIEVTTTPTTYSYPLGDDTGTVEYCPASINFTSNSQTRVVYVSLFDGTHPSNAPAVEYLTRYWSTRVSDNAGTYSYLPSFSYVAADVVGAVGNMHANTWNTYHWSEPNTTSTVASNLISYGTALTETTQSLGGALDWTARNGRCTGTPDAGSILASSAGPFCDNANAVLYLGGSSLNNGFTYQWQTSFTGNAGSYSDILGGINPTQFAGSSLTQYYRVHVACSYSGLIDSTANFQVVVNQSPTLTVTPSSGVVCGTVGVDMLVLGANTYAWSPMTGLVVAGNTATATPTVNTTYTVTGTDLFGCVGTAQAAITYSPSVPTFTIAATPNPICSGNDVALAATVGVSGINTTLLSQNFNGVNDWTRTNTSTTGAIDSAAWTLRPNGYVYDGETFNSNDASIFYITNSDLQGSGTTATTLVSPAFSTIGVTTCSLNFFHHYEFNGAGESGKVEVSTNGTTWTTLQTYNSDQGLPAGFVSATVSLNAYLNNPTVYVRFKYDATFDWYWAVDNVTVSGNTPYTYAWTSTEGLNSTAVSPTATVFDSATVTLTLTNSNGCTGAANTSLTVVPAAEVSAGVDETTCVGVGITLSTATQTNTASILWTHSGAGALTNATTLTPTYTPVAGDAGQNIILTLTGTGNTPCTSTLDQMAIAVTNLIQYYVDSDGDGFGTGIVAGSACTVPSGFAANNTDFCDTNVELNPNTEWWIDEDGDGIGSYIYGNGNVFNTGCFPPVLPAPATAVPYDPNQHGGALYGVDCNDADNEILHGGPFYVDADMDGFGDVNDLTPLFIPGTCATPSFMSFNNDDCNDANANISPLAAEVCNGIDDNCDGLTDNACTQPYSNDAPTGAISVNATAVFPTCNPTVGTNAYATVSSQSTSTTAMGGGRDVWYSFVAAGPTYQIRVYNAVGFDPLIELRTGAAATLPTLVSTQNAVANNTETMVIDGLASGTTYFVAVRCYDNSVGGSFNLCISRIVNSNDEITGAALVSANAGYSSCTLLSGSNLYATVSATATSATAVGGGRDVWYKFTATTPSIHLKVMNAVGFDPIIELRTGANGVTHVDTENISTGPNEIMNYQGLTVGNEYYFAVRCYNNSLGGTFSYCLTNFIASGCLSSQASIISNCSTFKFKSTNASSYVVTFVPTMGSVGGGSITTTGSFAAGSALVNLIPGNSYTVQVDATYQVANANAVLETIVIMGTPSCTVTIAAHSSIEVRANQRCSFPATLLRSSYMRSEPFVCGVTSYTFEFTPVVGCANNTPTGVGFTINHPSRILQLSFSGANTTPMGQTITGMTYYRVRVRPSFGPGSVPGTWGNEQIIYVGGSSMETGDAMSEEIILEQMERMEAEALIYPNPNNGELAVVTHGELEMPTTQIEVFDGTGKLAFSGQYTNDGNGYTVIEMEERLPSGLYLVHLTNGNRQERLRMVVTK